MGAVRLSPRIWTATGTRTCPVGIVQTTTRSPGTRTWEAAASAPNRCSAPRWTVRSSVYAVDLDRRRGRWTSSPPPTIDDKIAWYENLGGRELRAPSRLSARRRNGAHPSSLRTWTDDGDMDVLSGVVKSTTRSPGTRTSERRRGRRLRQLSAGCPISTRPTAMMMTSGIPVTTVRRSRTRARVMLDERRCSATSAMRALAMP